MAVQSRLVAGTGPRWERTEVSRSQWLVVMLDPMIWIDERPEHQAVEHRHRQPRHQPVEQRAHAEDEHGRRGEVQARLQHRRRARGRRADRHPDPATDAAGQAGEGDEGHGESEAAGEPSPAADGPGEQVVEVAVGLLVAQGRDLAGGGEGDERGEVEELVADPGGGAARVAAETTDRLLDGRVGQVRLGRGPGDHAEDQGQQWRALRSRRGRPTARVGRRGRRGRRATGCSPSPTPGGRARPRRRRGRRRG